MITVGTQEVDEDPTSVGMHVVLTLIPSMMTVTSSVDTIVETSDVVTTEVPKRVAVGVAWQSIRNYS